MENSNDSNDANIHKLELVPSETTSADMGASSDSASDEAIEPTKLREQKPAAKPALPPYRLDWDTKIVPVVIKHDKQRYVVKVEMARPTRDEVFTRDEHVSTTLAQREHSRSAYRHRSIDGDARMFNAIARQASDMLLEERWHLSDQEMTDQDREARKLKPLTPADLKNPEDGGLFNAEEKSAAIAGLFSADYEIKETTVAAVLTRGARARRTITVIESIPNAENPQWVVEHVVQSPTQSQRDAIELCTEVQAEAEKKKNQKRQAVVHIVSYLRQIDALYDQMTVSLDGVVLGPEQQPFSSEPEEAAKFFNFVSPISKRNVLLVVKDQYEPELGEQ